MLCVDSFAHTSSSFDGTTFPAGSPLGGAALNTFGDRLSTGWTAAQACLEVLRRDKKLIVFPLLSGISCLIVLASFAIPLAVVRPAFLAAISVLGAHDTCGIPTLGVIPWLDDITIDAEAILQQS